MGKLHEEEGRGFRERADAGAATAGAGGGGVADDALVGFAHGADVIGADVEEVGAAEF